MKVVWIILITLLIIGGIVGLIIYLMGKEGYKPINNNSKKYITFTNHLSKQLIPNKNTKFAHVAGTNHVKMCLNKLIQAAININRIAILPPPWKCIQRFHNNGNEIPEHINWDYYFDTSQLIEDNIIAPNDIRVHNRDGTVSWNNKTIQYIDRKHKLKNLDESKDIIVITYNEDPLNKIHHYECNIHHTKVKKDYLETPSKRIQNIAKEIYKNLGEFNMIHIRSPYQPWSDRDGYNFKNPKGRHRGDSMKKIMNASKVNNIYNKLTKNKISKHNPILICYHFDKYNNPNEELLIEYLSKLKSLPYTILFEKDIPELSQFLQNNDNNAIYEIIKQLSFLANKMIGTMSHTKGFKKCDIKL